MEDDKSVNQEIMMWRNRYLDEQKYNSEMEEYFIKNHFLSIPSESLKDYIKLSPDPIFEFIKQGYKDENR